MASSAKRLIERDGSNRLGGRGAAGRRGDRRSREFRGRGKADRRTGAAARARRHVKPERRYEREQRIQATMAGAPLASSTALSTKIRSRRRATIITRNKSPDISFDRSINPYRGCEHGCVYCFARPTHAYLGLSPGLDFETRLFVKADAAQLLEKELSAPH